MPAQQYDSEPRWPAFIAILALGGLQPYPTHSPPDRAGFSLLSSRPCSSRPSSLTIPAGIVFPQMTMSKEALKVADQQDCTDLHADWIFWRCEQYHPFTFLCRADGTLPWRRHRIHGSSMDSYQHFTRTRLSAWRICQPTESKSD